MNTKRKAAKTLKRYSKLQQVSRILIMVGETNLHARGMIIDAMLPQKHLCKPIRSERISEMAAELQVVESCKSCCMCQ